MSNVDTPDPFNHPALVTPGYEGNTGGHRTILPEDPHRAQTEPGRDSEELPLVDGSAVCRTVPLAAATLTEEQQRHVALQRSTERALKTTSAGIKHVMDAVTLPVMGKEWEATRDLRRMLHLGQNIVHCWADVGDTMLGTITHEVPGIHGNILTVAEYAAKAGEQLDRAVAKPHEWNIAFKAIVAEAAQVDAFTLTALASGALAVGPFTETWDNAVDWCLTLWGQRA